MHYPTESPLESPEREDSLLQEDAVKEAPPLWRSGGAHAASPRKL